MSTNSHKSPNKHIQVFKIRLGPSNNLECIPLEVSTDVWQLQFRYIGMVQEQQLPLSDRRLKDASTLIIYTWTSILLEFCTKITVPQMKEIATCHHIRTNKLRCTEVLDLLRTHACTPQCRMIFYIFKELPNVKDGLRGRKRMTMENLGHIQRPSARIHSTPAAAPPQPTDTCEYRTPFNSRASTETTSQGRTTAIKPRCPPYLKPLPDRMKRQIIKSWQKKMAASRFIRRACAPCSTLKARDKLHCTHPDEINLNLLRNDDLPAHLLPQTYNLHAYNHAILDPSSLDDTQVRSSLRLCARCLKDLKRARMPKFALCNWLYYARECIPPEVQAAFNSLTVFEKALICHVRTNSVLCRFSGFEQNDKESFSTNNQHIRGNVISTPLNIPKLNNILPPSPSTIRDTICALIVSKAAPTSSNISDLHPVLVRKSKVKLIIEFLLLNNPHYQGSTSFRGFSSENLEALFDGPDDIGVPASARISHLPLNKALESVMSDYTDRHDSLDGIFMENTAYTIGDKSSASYREMSLQALKWCKDGKPFVHTRSGSTPIPDIGNPNWLSWAHPNADPFGVAGFNDPRRRRRISPEAQLRHLLNVSDPFFETEFEVAFDIYNIIRKAAVNSTLRFSVPISSYTRIISEIRAIERHDLEALKDKFRHDPSYVATTDRERKIIRLMSSISPVARGIPGGVSQRIKMRNEIRAIINQKGCPTLFITLNPADQHNPIVAVLARDAFESSFDDLTLKSRSLTALRHPAASAKFFDSMIKNFVAIVLRANGNRQGIFGTCESYYGTVETQGRGSLHCHMLIWLRGHLHPEVLAEKLRSSEKYRKRMIRWVDSIMDSGFQGSRTVLNDIPNLDHQEVVPEELTHPGTLKGPQISELNANTFDKEMKEHLDDLLLKYNWHRHTGTCWKYLRPGQAREPSNCHFGMDGSVYPKTRVDSAEGRVTARRRHPRMTNFNPIVTFLLKCNTDIKLIGSGEDAKAFMYYATDYITKSPLSMYAGLSALSYALRQYDSKCSTSTYKHADGDARRAMTIAVNSMLGHQEFSHPQVMSFLVGGGESYTCETFQHINWAEVLRFVTFSDEYRRNDNDSLNDRLTLSISAEKTTVNASNKLLDYMMRPTCEPFESMCLYKHLAWTYKESKSKSKTGGRKNNSFSTAAHPQFHSHSLKARKKPVVPVLLGPRIHRTNAGPEELELWAKDVTILFKPWRNPCELREPGEEWLKTLEKFRAHISPWEAQILENISLLSEAKHARDAGRPRGPPRDKAPPTFLEGDAFDDLHLEIEEPSLERNVYDQATHLTKENSKNDLFCLNFENILGKDANEKFELCLTPSVNPQLLQASTSIAASISGAHKRLSPTLSRTISAQVSYMNSCRFLGSQSQQNDHSENTSQQDVTSHTPTLAIPDATVTRTRPDDTDTIRASQWNIVNDLISAHQLNNEQRRAFTIIAHHLIEGGEQLFLYIGGEGGTGKSYLVNTVVLLFESLGKSQLLRLGAPTGIAASLIKGHTLHHLLSINPIKKSKSNKRLIAEWKNAKYFVVDEVSMLGSHFMASMSSKLKTAKADFPSEYQKIFGGINMIFMGDFYQLTPPKQPSLFCHKLVHNPSFMEARNSTSISSLGGAFLWRQVQLVTLLQENKRQKEEGTLAKILANLRSHHRTNSDGSPVAIDGVSILEHLRRRELSYMSTHNKDDLALFKNAPVIVGNKTLRDAANVRLMIAHAQDSRQEIHLYYSLDRVKKTLIQGSNASKLWDLPSRLTSEALGKLPMFPGMKVMLTENLSVPYKIVNGSEGIVKDIVYEVDDLGHRIAKAVYVEIAKCDISAPDLAEGVVPIFPTQTSIKLRHPVQGLDSKSFRREQIPLVPAYSYTDYKSQGRTLTRAIIDLASARGQGVYVMLSRVTSLEGILILRPFPKTKITQRMPQELRDELDRLNRLNEQTQTLYTPIVENFAPKTPHSDLSAPHESEVLAQDRALDS